MRPMELSVERFKRRPDELSCECELEAISAIALGPTRIIMALSRGDEDAIFDNTEAERIIIFETAKRKVAIYEEGEDYTGHG